MNNVHSNNTLNNSDYSPFGMRMSERSSNSSLYRYGYQGSESDDEVKGEGNSYDFGSRIYDPRIGKWLSADPLESKFSYYSPYGFALSNPMYFIDPNGEIVRIAGDLKKAEDDMVSILPLEYQPLLSIVDNEVVLDITMEEAIEINDPVIIALRLMIDSDKVYEWNVSDNVEVFSKWDGSRGVVQVEKLHGASKNSDRWKRERVKYVKKVKRNGEKIYSEKISDEIRSNGQSKPVDQEVDFQRTMNPSHTGHGPNDPRKTIVVHEILEMFLEGEYNLPYQTAIEYYDGPEDVGAHNGARIIQSTLTDDRRGETAGSAPATDKNGKAPELKD